MSSATITARALHYVFRIGDRAKNAHFFRNVLGMTVLRHEEFKEGCDAQCNGPYDNRWSKTMIGYGPEDKHFVIELTYNYGVQSYKLGNDFGGITIKSAKALERAKVHDYPITVENGRSALISPDGYKFYIDEVSESADTDCLTETTLHVSNLATSRQYWHDLLNMLVLSEDDQSILLSYGKEQASLRLRKLDTPMDRGEAYGRIAFAVPFDLQPTIDAAIQKANAKILTPLISLDTPDKATVRVIILADPDGHEICFVDDEGFSQLSQVDPEGDALLKKYIDKDPFQTK